MTNEGFHSNPNLSTSEKEAATREAADRFIGVGSHRQADPSTETPSGYHLPLHFCQQTGLALLSPSQ